MKTLAVLLSGVAFGALGMFVAQGYADQGRPGVYIVSETDVSDADNYAKVYAPPAIALVKKHGGQVIASGGAATSPVAGGNRITPIGDESRATLPPTRRMVITAFPDLDTVKAYISDPEYTAVREKATSAGWAKFRAYAIDAVAPTAN
jgi:uncharacterized protein (DUF1330 family)